MTMLPKNQRQKSQNEGELTAGKRLYATTDLQGATITADALHCERESMHQVVEKGGDFLFNSKIISPMLLNACCHGCRDLPPFTCETLDPIMGGLMSAK